uniref:Uncharacterized protein n=1 Tax=Branchiostoma floridae TaxID=7739 RepID=C3ZFW6_BRAFL|eukprot:XP_002592593.1 hypothetical protein BRAFLDRAFT_68916 [Branchiostoma floridae]
MRSQRQFLEDALEKERTALLEEIRISELAKEVEDLRRRKVQLQFRSTARREFTPPPPEASPWAPTGPGREGQGLAGSIDVESAKDKSAKDRPGLSQDQAVTHDAASPHDVARTIQDLRRDSAAVAEVDRILGAMSLQPAPVLPLPDPKKLSLPDPSVQPVRQNPGLGLPAANPSMSPVQTNPGPSSVPPAEQPAKPSPNPLLDVLSFTLPPSVVGVAAVPKTGLHPAATALRALLPLAPFFPHAVKWAAKTQV